jgi:hypothetical protein
MATTCASRVGTLLAITAFMATVGRLGAQERGVDVFRWPPAFTPIAISGSLDDCFQIVAYGRHNFPHDAGVPAVLVVPDLPRGLYPSPFPSQQGGAPFAGALVTMNGCPGVEFVLELSLHDSSDEGFPFPQSSGGDVRILVPEGEYSIFISAQEIWGVGGDRFLSGIGTASSEVFDVTLDPIAGTLVPQ